MKRIVRVCLIVSLSVVCILAVIPVVRNRECKPLDDVARSQASGTFVKLSKGYTHFQTNSGGNPIAPPVILVHGFSVPMYIWDSTYTALSASGLPVLRYDLWGRGYSSRPKADYDLPLFIQQLKELIDSLHLKTPVDLIGVSMGGTVVAGFVSKYPELVRKVVLIDPFSQQMGITPLDIPILGNYFAWAYWIPNLPNGQSGDFYHPDNFPHWASQYKEQMKYRGFGKAVFSSALNILGRSYIDSSVLLKKKPVLLIWGKYDRTVPLAQSDTLRKIFNPEFLLVDEAGHLPMLEQAARVNPVIINFLR